MPNQHENPGYFWGGGGGGGGVIEEIGDFQGICNEKIGDLRELF